MGWDGRVVVIFCIYVCVLLPWVFCILAIVSSEEDWAESFSWMSACSISVSRWH
jgi:hypothetical protein